jgi:hypothetical protein
MKRLILPLTTILLMLALGSGCSTAKPEAMVPQSFTVGHKHESTVGVAQPVDPTAEWAFKVTAAAFTEALTTSLGKSGAFSKVLSTPEGDYLLEVAFVKKSEPAFGFNMTVELVTRWTLTKKSATDPVFRENVASTFTATVGDAFAGVKRVRVANEGAARENIKEGIRRLSQLKL